jgi:hypothetical protein
VALVITIAALLILAHVCATIAHTYEKAIESPWLYGKKDKQLFLYRMKLLYDFFAWGCILVVGVIVALHLGDVVATWMDGLPPPKISSEGSEPGPYGSSN